MLIHATSVVDTGDIKSPCMIQVYLIRIRERAYSEDHTYCLSIIKSLHMECLPLHRALLLHHNGHKKIAQHHKDCILEYKNLLATNHA